MSATCYKRTLCCRASCSVVDERCASLANVVLTFLPHFDVFLIYESIDPRQHEISFSLYNEKEKKTFYGNVIGTAFLQ